MNISRRCLAETVSVIPWSLVGASVGSVGFICAGDAQLHLEVFD